MKKKYGLMTILFNELLFYSLIDPELINIDGIKIADDKRDEFIDSMISDQKERIEMYKQNPKFLLYTENLTQEEIIYSVQNTIAVYEKLR